MNREEAEHEVRALSNAVRAAIREEREACAKVAEATPLEKPHHRFNHYEDKHAAEIVQEIAAAIRARGKE